MPLRLAGKAGCDFAMRNSSSFKSCWTGLDGLFFGQWLLKLQFFARITACNVMHILIQIWTIPLYVLMNYSFPLMFVRNSSFVCQTRICASLWNFCCNWKACILGNSYLHAESENSLYFWSVLPPGGFFVKAKVFYHEMNINMNYYTQNIAKC